VILVFGAQALCGWLALAMAKGSKPVPKDKKEWTKRFRMEIHRLLDELDIAESQSVADDCFRDEQILQPELAAKMYAERKAARK
jgi:hypothetical protein